MFQARDKSEQIVGLSSTVVDRRPKHWMYFKTTVHCLPLFFCQARSNSVFIPAYYSGALEREARLRSTMGK